MDRIQSALNYFNSNQFDEILRILSSMSWADYKDCARLRKELIAPAILAKQFSLAESLLQLILAQHPQSSTDLVSLSSVLSRQNKREQACLILEQVLVLNQDDYAVVAQLIQLRYQNKQLEEAAQLAMRYGHAFSAERRLFKIALMILSKAKQFEFAIQRLGALDFSQFPLDIGLLAAQLAFDGKNYELSQTILKQLANKGHQDAGLELILAKNLLTVPEQEEQAITVLVKASVLNPEHVQINALLGELLLKTGKASDALFYLEKCKDLLAKNPHTRLLHARAFKETGQFEEAAKLMLGLVELFPDSLKWKRYAASALAQAGRKEEAMRLFEETVKRRDQHLPDHFEMALNQLWDKRETVVIPEARFKWLWLLIDPSQEIQEETRRSYEQEARWIHLLDHLLIDWLECRPNQADEIMAYFDDLSEIDAVLKHQLAFGKGLILAGAHLGPLFAIPLALELLGFPHKWLASTPNISSLAYKHTLISTSEHSETEVVRQIIKALRQQEIAALAVDGAMSPSAPRIHFENQKVTYSDFAAKMAYRQQAPSFFICSYWKKGSIGFQLKALPQAEEGESLENFCTRWRNSFFSQIKNYLIQHPSNARLSGGLWRHVKNSALWERI